MCKWPITSILVFFLVGANAQESGREAALEEFAAKISWQQQQEPAQYRRFRPAFINALSDEDPAAIDAAVSADLEGRDKTIGFLAFMKADHGPIRDLQFRYFDAKKQRQNSRKLAVYHCVFEDGSWWDLRIGLDTAGRVDRLIITDPNYNEALPARVGSRPLELPFAAGEKWYVLWGGVSEETNYHVTSRSQRNAMDLLIRHPYSKQTYFGSGQVNEDYYAFGHAVLAPIAGKVINVIDGVEDNVPGQLNPSQLTGNTVLIQVHDDEYLLLAHLKKFSIRVQEGDLVSAGEPIGHVGNSGNSSEPHLHMQLMSAPIMKDAIGLEMRFEHLAIQDSVIVENYSPVRTDVIEKLEPSAAASAAQNP